MTTFPSIQEAAIPSGKEQKGSPFLHISHNINNAYRSLKATSEKVLKFIRKHPVLIGVLSHATSFFFSPVTFTLGALLGAHATLLPSRTWGMNELCNQMNCPLSTTLLLSNNHNTIAGVALAVSGIALRNLPIVNLLTGLSSGFLAANWAIGSLRNSLAEV